MSVITSSVDAVLGRSATLPCDIEPGIREDRVYMVLWYRDTNSKPIYSFDVRGRPFNKALHWSDPKVFGPRAYFVTVSKPAALTLDGVSLDDEGIYRCRVDFRTTPTRNFAINLTVIDDTAVYKKSNHFHGGNGGILSLAKVKLNPIRSVGQTEANCFGKRRPKDDRGN
ncbi:hypothetical protein MTP99_000046 [Tenebrio molitor]|nr:hypothetical protein MTP99_000046 [Tenebrio molitor]